MLPIGVVAENASSNSLARLGREGSRIAVSWTEPTLDSGASIARFELPLSSTAMAAPLGETTTVMVPAADEWIAYTHLLETNAGVLMLAQFRELTGLPGPEQLRSVRLLSIAADSVGPAFDYPAPALGTNVNFAAAYEGGSDTAALIFFGDCDDAWFCRRALARFSPLGETNEFFPLASGRSPFAVLDIGESGQLAHFDGRNVPSTGVLNRMRLSDTTAVPDEGLALESVSGITAIPQGPLRAVYYTGATDDGMTYRLEAVPILCP